MPQAHHGLQTGTRGQPHQARAKVPHTPLNLQSILGSLPLPVTIRRDVAKAGYTEATPPIIDQTDALHEKANTKAQSRIFLDSFNSRYDDFVRGSKMHTRTGATSTPYLSKSHWSACRTLSSPGGILPRGTTGDCCPLKLQDEGGDTKMAYATQAAVRSATSAKATTISSWTAPTN